MRIALYVAAGLVAVVLIIVVIGYALPQSHTASREKTFAASPDRVFAAIGTPQDFPSWRRDVKSVDVLPPVDGKTRFRENGSNGPILFEIVESQPGKRLVTRIADPKLPFGGKWTYELTPNGAGTTLRITEEGEVYNPVFRFMSRFVFGHTSTIESYLAALERRLGPSAN
jgi:uncharacterized protein YndB with AHSA1/START domain